MFINRIAKIPQLESQPQNGTMLALCHGEQVPVGS
jgi:hypothetical protein